MDSFDLQKLTDYDFEALCKDVLEEILGVRLEIFSQGADKGIDLRYMSARGSSIVIQCKHWFKSDRSTFIRRLKKDELPKVRKLEPERYIIATSVPMNPQAKEVIQADFDPYVKSPSDILGLEDITRFIASRPEIVRRHIRLWLNDATVLESALSRNVLWRSEHFSEEVQETLRTYVPNDSFRQALGLLEESHVCIISGIPGVGKTTLAHILSANYADQGYELVHISADIEDAYRLWDKRARQLFVYDDFLGQSVLDDKLNKNEDQRLISIMKRIKGDPRKRLICTTRGYILEQARQRYERLSSADFSPMTFTVEVDQYTRDVRAAILYNHVFWSAWPDEIKAMFSIPGNYEPVIEHRNFNPRVISATLAADFDASLGHPSSQLVGNLDDPALVWQHIYELQLSKWERDLLSVVLTLPRGQVSALENALLARTGWTRPQIRQSLQVLDGTFLSVRQGSFPTVEFHNPSASEFVVGELFSHPSALADIISAVRSFEQLEKLWSLLLQRFTEGLDEYEAYVSILADSALTFCGKGGTDRAFGSSLIVSSFEIAEASGNAKLAKRVAEMLSTRGVVYRIRYFSEILELIKGVGESKNPHIRACYESVRLEGLSAILNREEGRAAPVRAALYALELVDFLGEATCFRICDAAVGVAYGILDEYDDAWGDVGYDDVEVALHFAEQWAPRENFWPDWEQMMSDLGVASWEGIEAAEMGQYDDFDENDIGVDAHEGDPVFGLMQSLSSSRHERE
ncbi:restriction endonuclease [Streptomyces sp. NPDC059063]|uniref:nSTAND3 domain-containing NTPase n=1 Tax=unclassified Streptomyces TaxID=2593676 RepID=UPI00369369A7